MELAALKDEDPKALRSIAKKLLEKAAEGDLGAIKELVDRTDGKAVQQVEMDANVSLSHEEALEQLG